MTTEGSTPASMLEVFDHRHHLWNITRMMSVMVYLCLCLFLAAFLCCNYELTFSLSVGVVVNLCVNLKPDFCQKCCKSFCAKVSCNVVEYPESCCDHIVASNLLHIHRSVINWAVAVNTGHRIYRVGISCLWLWWWWWCWWWWPGSY